MFEELQNAFGTYSMNTDSSLELFTVFTQSRSDALIHYMGIGQRLNDISTKICERLRPLVGLTVGENSLRKIKSMLPKHLKNTVQQLPKRTWIYLNGKEDPIIEMPIYRKEGKPFMLKPKPILSALPKREPYKRKKEPLLKRIRKSQIATILRNLFAMPEPRTEPIKPKYDVSYGLDNWEQEDDELTEENEENEEFEPI